MMTQSIDDVVVQLRNRLGERMRIHQVVGESGPEVLVTARDLERHVQVVLKILVSGTETPPDAMQRFEREAEVAGRLRHLNIAAVEPVQRQEELAYYAMNLDYVGTWEALLSKQPPPTFEESIDLLRDVASALDFAHTSRTIHGRLSPSVIFMDAEDQVIVSGFGSAVGPGAASYSISAAYLAPEQWQNLTVEDGRVDVYALGVIAFELLSGKRRNFAFAPSEFLAMEPFAITLNTPLRKGLSLGVNEAIAKATSNRPALRFATAGEFVSALELTPQSRGFRLSRQTAQSSPVDPSPPSTRQPQSEVAPRATREEKAHQPPPPAPIPIARQSTLQQVRRPPSQQVNWAPHQPVIQPASQQAYKPVYRTSHQEDQLQWKPPQQKASLPVSHERGNGEGLKMFVMTVVFLLAMAALSGPEFLRVAADRTGLSFLRPWSSARISSSAENGTVVAPSDSLVKPRSKNRHRAKSSKRVSTPAKVNAVSESAGSVSPAIPGATYGFVRVLLPGDSQPVLIDGLPRGNTPLLARLPVGTHAISVVGTRAASPSQVSVTLKGGDTAVALFSAEP
jgi:serine/threonine protein kinase